MSSTTTSNGSKKNGDGNDSSFSWFEGFASVFKEICNRSDKRRIIHSIKVGVALVLVSLLYLVNSMFKQIGENAMWAIMTVVVMFELYAGATLSKGINRGVGTLIGGGMGCLAAVLAAENGGIAKPTIVVISLFAYGTVATYYRMVPNIKKRYDYGFMISILTFNLVAVSGVRAEKVVEVARDRLAAIGMGFILCIFVNLFIFPIWARCFDEYFKLGSDKEIHDKVGDGSASILACKIVINSKSNDEALANHAKWEPWHGKFGLYYPWDKYLEIGEHLRELAATIISLKGCLQSPKQPLPLKRQMLKGQCDDFLLSMIWILNEIGDTIGKMEKCQTKLSINPKLQLLKLQLSPPGPFSCKIEVVETDENLAILSSNFLMLEIVEKVEILAAKVEELGEIANFRATKMDV
ncbi:aluminum-activated malate transporter 13-like isoform X2 [Salvia hispanica]|uniref:aluminum-activated malate transporter 13-like isoform X2 n=1 Tax=Salvia hispanica TaxID=49212 RepID=UPI002009B916|nr:aluminum-activated malate transporter 13-like isoform X2 [Salvia hispanica]